MQQRGRYKISTKNGIDSARAMEIKLLKASRFKNHVGKGIEAVVDRKELLVGNEKIFIEKGISLDELKKNASEMSSEGKTPIFIGIDGRVAGIIALSDEPRSTAEDAIERLKSFGIDVLLVTGDSIGAARYIAEKVGIDDFIAGAAPSDKVNVINRLKENEKIVGMIGDGVNDAPALAAADVGFAVDTGTDIAIESSPVTLVNGDISKVADAILLSKKTMTIIKENLFWAFAYNMIAVPAAALGKLNPTIAAAAMALSSVSVVTNSLRLQRCTITDNEAGG